MSSEQFAYLLSLADQLRCPFAPPRFFGVDLYARLQNCKDDAVKKKFRDIGVEPTPSWRDSPMYDWNDFERAFGSQG